MNRKPCFEEVMEALVGNMLDWGVNPGDTFSVCVRGVHARVRVYHSPMFGWVATYDIVK